MSYGPVPGTLYVPNTYQEAMVFHPLLAQRVLKEGDQRAVGRANGDVGRTEPIDFGRNGVQDRAALRRR